MRVHGWRRPARCTGWGVLAVTMALACGPPPSPGAPEGPEHPTARRTESIPAERLEWLKVYERAGFPDIRGHQRVELIAPVQTGTQYAWQLDTSPPRYLRDHLWEISEPCEAPERAPEALAAAQVEAIRQHGCQRLRAEALPAEFLPELEARLLAFESRRKCAQSGTQTRGSVAEAAWPMLPVMMPSRTPTERPTALTWVAYAHWAQQLGREDLTERALAAADHQAKLDCRTSSCETLVRLEAEAQRVLVGSALFGLGVTWMTRATALELARRAVRVAPKSSTPIAAQARALAAELEQDLGRDGPRRRASQLSPNELGRPAQLALYLDLLPDESGTSLGTPEYRCAESSPTAALVRLAPDSVPALIERLHDDRLTRTVRARPGSLLPIARVGDIALDALAHIAARKFDRTRAHEEVSNWWSSSKHQSLADFAAEALQRAAEPERVARARELGDRDLLRMVRELGTVCHQTQDARVRAQLVRLLEAGALTAAFARGQCKAATAPSTAPSPTGHWFPAISQWETMQQRSRDRIELPPLERRAMFRVLLQSIHDSSPEVRVAAADALLSWGRHEGLRPVTQYAATLDSQPGNADRRAQVIRVLMRSGKGQAIAVASELVDEEQSVTLEAAAKGLSQALVFVRNHGGTFHLPDAGKDRLSRVATQALRTRLQRLGGQYATVAIVHPSAEWLLRIVTSGRDFSPPRYQTPFERHHAVLELVNSQLRARGEQALSVPIAELPPAPAALEDTAWSTATRIVKWDLDNWSAGEDWLESRRGQVVIPIDLLRDLGALAQANPGRALHLRIIRHARGRGVSLEFGAHETADPLAAVHAKCFGPDPCPSLAHDDMAMHAVDSRLRWFADELSKRWANHRDHTLDIVVSVTVPPSMQGCKG